MKKLLLYFTLLFSGMSLVSCGYTTGSALPSNLKTIYVSEFKNNIDFSTESRRNLYFPLLEVDVRNQIIERFLFDGNLRVTDENQADLILRGELTGYDRGALRYTDNDDVQEYRVHIIVSLKMYDARTQEVMWTETSFVGEATYFITGAQATTEESALQEAVEDLARRIVERTIEDW
ncbi:MAG: LptE family protein [Candidatus Omnitrophica bacterium]|nr:LptE family protein [Candidatus Omnitrophota bacterium]